MAEKTRLQKILAECGIASRRKAEELIAAGRVTVNGYVAHLGDSALPGKDRIAVDGQTIEGGGKKIYLALHKMCIRDSSRYPGCFLRRFPAICCSPFPGCPRYERETPC